MLLSYERKKIVIKISISTRKHMLSSSIVVTSDLSSQIKCKHTFFLVKCNKRSFIVVLHTKRKKTS